MPAATVIVPTHDHGPLLRWSVRSALRQDVKDLEVVVICDGAPEEMRNIVDELVDGDPRVSYVWCAKGERLGELHRNDVLADCDSEIVCYLSDDDLWAPGHLTAMRDGLREHDVVHANHVFVDGESQMYGVAVSLTEPVIRAAHLSGTSFKSLSTIGHTLDAYRTGGLRWRVTPKDRYTDWYFLTGAMEAGLDIGATDSFTVLNIAGVFRRGWDLDTRLDEIERWSAAIETDWPAIVQKAAANEMSSRATHQLWIEARERELTASLDATARDLSTVGSERDAITAELTAMREQLNALGTELDIERQRAMAGDEEIASLRDLVATRDSELDALSRAHADLTDVHRQVMATKAMRMQQRLARSGMARRLLGGQS